MHHSRLSTFVIDCRTENADEAARFWSAALGRRIEGADGEYRQLAGSADEPILLVQKVDHPGRIHLDIETDDQEAEVKRLEALGARRIERVKTWWVLEAPTGQRFCVINPQRGPLKDHANEWT
jgi:glyoxalase superfamily protein